MPVGVHAHVCVWHVLVCVCVCVCVCARTCTCMCMFLHANVNMCACCFCVSVCVCVCVCVCACVLEFGSWRVCSFFPSIVVLAWHCFFTCLYRMLRWCFHPHTVCNGSQVQSVGAQDWHELSNLVFRSRETSRRKLCGCFLSAPLCEHLLTEGREATGFCNIGKSFRAGNAPPSSGALKNTCALCSCKLGARVGASQE
jgi:hypothetical protein